MVVSINVILYSFYCSMLVQNIKMFFTTTTSMMLKLWLTVLSNISKT